MPPASTQLARAALPVAEVMLLQSNEQFLNPNRLPLAGSELILVDLVQSRRKSPLRRRLIRQSRSLADAFAVFVELNDPGCTTGLAENATRASASAHFAPPFFAAFLAFACRALPAFRARSVRCCGVRRFALALPPIRPSSLKARRRISLSLIRPFSFRY